MTPRDEMCRRLAAEVDELSEQRIERNAEIKRLREALVRCAEIAGADGESIEALRWGAMTFPDLPTFALEAVQQLRDDYDHEARA